MKYEGPICNIGLTQRIPQPVGRKAKMQANISETDSLVNTTAAAKPANASKKETPWIKRSTSWKLTDIF